MINIRRAVRADASSFARIEKECFSRPWDENAFEESFDNGCSVFFAAENDDSAVVGFIGADDVGGEVYISNVAVNESCRRQKIGSALVAAMLDYCEESGAQFITLEVRVSNEAAIALYEKNGFENLGRRKNFYSAPTEDAFIMTKYFGKNDN